jgi:hypothetical protein
MTFHKSIAVSGAPTRLSGYLASTAAAAGRFAFVNGGASASTITDSSSELLLAGFKAGDKIKITGTVDNDGTYTIATVIAGTITLTEAGVLTNETASTVFSIEEVNASEGGTNQSAGVIVPEGVKILIKAFDSNTGVVTVGYSSATALNTTTYNYRLLNLEAITLQVDNINKIWIDSTASSDKVMVSFEYNG